MPLFRQRSVGGTQQRAGMRLEAYFITILVVTACNCAYWLPKLRHRGHGQQVSSSHTVVSTLQVLRESGIRNRSQAQPQTTFTAMIFDTTTSSSGDGDSVTSSSVKAQGGAAQQQQQRGGAVSNNAQQQGQVVSGQQRQQQPDAQRKDLAGGNTNQMTMPTAAQHQQQQQRREAGAAADGATTVPTEQQQKQQHQQQSAGQTKEQQKQQQQQQYGHALGAGDPSGSSASALASATATPTNANTNANSSGASATTGNGSRPAATTATAGTGSVPADFEWETYLRYYPDLKDAGIDSEAAARAHYLASGSAEGRVYKRLRLVLRYTACSGLINQQYSHLAAFTLGVALGAEIVLPPAIFRDSFAKHFSADKAKNEVVWGAADTNTLLDVQGIIAYWRDRGITVHKCPGLEPFPDMTVPATAFPLYKMPGVEADHVARMGDVYVRNMDLNELVEKVRVAVLRHASKWNLAHPGGHLEQLVLDLPCTLFMLRTAGSTLGLAGEVARSLRFAPHLEALAQRVVAGIRNSGALAGGAGALFNGLHLRVEKDAQDWTNVMGGEAVVWRLYIEAMHAARFSPDTPLYVASGLLTYGDLEDMRLADVLLQATGMCSEVLYKEHFLSRDDLAALNSEQEALLDFMILVHSRSFVGFGPSTFSFYLRELRALNGVPRSHSVLVDAPVVGTNPLFDSAGTLI